MIDSYIILAFLTRTQHISNILDLYPSTTMPPRAFNINRLSISLLQNSNMLLACVLAALARALIPNPTTRMTAIIARLFHAIHNSIPTLRRPRLVIRTGKHESILVMVILALTQAPRRGDEVKQRVDDQREEEAREKAESGEFHQVVGRAIYVGAGDDIAWEGGSDGQDKGEEGSPVVSDGDGSCQRSSAPIVPAL